MLSDLIDKLTLFIDTCQFLYEEGIQKLLVTINYESREFEFCWLHEPFENSHKVHLENLNKRLDKNFLHYLKINLYTTQSREHYWLNLNKIALQEIVKSFADQHSLVAPEYFEAEKFLNQFYATQEKNFLTKTLPKEDKEIRTNKI